VDGRDGMTPAWAEVIKTDAVALPTYLIPSRSEEAKIPAEELPSQEAVRRFVQMCGSWRAECYLVIASVLLGLVIALAIWGNSFRFGMILTNPVRCFHVSGLEILSALTRPRKV
jgi:hypothetical protein